MAEEMGMTRSYKTPELHAVISPQFKTALQRLQGDQGTFLLLLVLIFRNVQNEEGIIFYPVKVRFLSRWVKCHPVLGAPSVL